MKEIYKYLKLKIFKQNIEEEFPFKLKGLGKKDFCFNLSEIDSRIIYKSKIK